MEFEMIKLILMDLDDTLLRSDKTISAYSARVLNRCRQKGYLIGFITARGEYNARIFIDQMQPDIVVSSGGAMIRMHGETLFCYPLSAEDTQRLISAARRENGDDCRIAVDAMDCRYWNQKDVQKSADWGVIRYSDFSDFHECALRLSMKLKDQEQAAKVAASIESCDWVNFLNGEWYKFSRVEATKEHAVARLAEHLGLSVEEIIAFGDDYGDRNMLQFCGTGVAMANAMDSVKAAADAVTLDNDHDGVAHYLERCLLEETE